MKYLYIVFICIFFLSCQDNIWTSEEKNIIEKQGQTMRVLTINNFDDSLILRQKCTPISNDEIQSNLFRLFSQKMISTVTSPQEDGVGIAGPQVGITRRIVAVQRFDKQGEPFEIYPNIKIIAHRGQLESGAEGCLSVPDRRGNVMRYKDIDISYTSIHTLKDTTETIKGFTAVIFQHEVDHLNGILYIDKVIN